VDQQHEYAILGGFNRSSVGRRMTQMAAAISGAATFVVLEIFDLAKRLGLPSNAPPIVLLLVGAGSVYAFFYWLLDRHLWRIAVVARFLKVPDLAGDWVCEGQTLDVEGAVRFAWSGKVRIIQSYDKIQVRLKTAQSGSCSVAAALQCDAAGGYRLLYHYRNDPRIGEPELQAHRGFGDMMVASDGRTAEGEYFNGAGRNTFGRMTWTKEI
jgi:hypothetical protein